MIILLIVDVTWLLMLLLNRLRGNETHMQKHVVRRPGSYPYTIVLIRPPLTATGR